jgi:amidase
MPRQALLLAALLAAGLTQAAPLDTSAAQAPAFAFEEATVADLQARMQAGTLDSHALTQAYLDRIAALDDAGPMLGAVIELNPQALAEADALDAERAAGHVRGPMHGIPVLLKDNIDAVPMVNSGGSLALANNRPTNDAFLVQRLRDAGAVILGKTNLSEWANFRSTRSTSGWSSRGGQTKSPYALDRNPCGSSAGTGTAIAANLATVGIGTETDGSIICPSAVAGLVGIKPTVGLVSRDGIIPISVSQDTAGPMARTVADAAALLTAVAGVDASDPAGSAAEGHVATDYTAFLDAGALKGKRIGVLRAAMGYHPDVDAATEHAIAAMKAAGAEVVDAEVAGYDKWGDAEYSVLLYEFKDGLDAYLADAVDSPKSLEALIAWDKAHAAEAMPTFGQEIFEQAQAKGTLADKDYLEAKEKARRMAGAEGLLATLAKDKLDAIVAPSMSPAWLTDPVLGDHFVGAGYGMAAVAGTPSITVPSGESHGLPIGLTFMGPAYSEPQLIALAYAFEQLTHARKPPEFLPTAP